MIYDMTDRIDSALSEFAGRDLSYAANKDFRSGFDTAWDIATCCNERTIWRSVEDNPDTNRDVLVYTSANKVTVGWFDWDRWCRQGSMDELLDSVVMWAELPDAPAEEENDEG